MPELVIENVSKRFGEARALAAVSLTLGEGEIVALQGPSGAGKTTLLRVVAGLDHADEGRVTLGGRLLVGPGVFVPPEKRGVGMMFQEPALWPHMRALRNVTFVLGRLPRRERKRRATELLDRLGVGGLARRYPHELSAGERRRVALARVLAARPGVMLLDEPFANLDEELRRELAALIARIRTGEGASVLFVSHLEKESLDYSDRVVIIKEGRIL